MMTKEEAVLNWLDTFPLITKKSKNDYVSLEYFGNGVNFSISNNPLVSNGLIKKDVLGNEVRGYSFMFSAYFDYTKDVMQMVSNSSFFEEFESWIEEKNKINELPEYGIPKSVIVQQTPILFAVDENGLKAQYSMQLQFIYLKKF